MGAPAAVAEFTATPLVLPWPARGQAEWRTALPKFPSAGWKNGTGYNEPRAVVIAQWHDSEVGDLNHMRHIHLEVALPRVIRTPTLFLEQRGLNFHWFGGSFESFRKQVTRNWSGRKILAAPVKEDQPGVYKIPIPLDASGHMVETYGPLLFDLSAVGTTPRWIELELDVQSIRPDGQSAQARLNKLFMWADLGHTGLMPTVLKGRFGAEGWVSSPGGGADFGYLSLEAWGMRQFDTDRPADYPTLFIKPGSSPKTLGHQTQLLVMKNPNLHRHDVVQPDGSLGPDYGEVLLNTTFTMPVQFDDRDAFRIPHPPMTLHDKILIRLADASDPDIGAGATLQGWVLGRGN